MSSKKHIMLSYQWDHQKLVTEVYRRLKELNIPLWMDTQGGMKGHLSESMAEGVENAAAVCCFLTPKYQDSVACKDELTYAKDQRVCIIPILLERNWKPKGWLGFTIAGHKWINFRDIDTNMNVRFQQLVDEIQMLVGNQLNCFKDVRPPKSESQPSNETHEAAEDEDVIFPLPESDANNFDPNAYYRITSSWQGPGKSLDVVNDGIKNDQLQLARTGHYSGQYWKITPISGEFYRLTTNWQGPDKSLDIDDDGKDDSSLILTDSGNFDGQSWKITPIKDGFYRLTTRSYGLDKSLDIVNDGINNNKLKLARTGNFSGQLWKITLV